MDTARVELPPLPDKPKTHWERFTSWLSNTANVLTVASLFASSSFAAFVAYLRDSHRLTTLFLVLAVFCAVFLVAQTVPPVTLWLRYRRKPPKTTVELIGGHSLTLVVQNRGLPVKVRARATFMEFGEDMESHAAPYDLQLFTRVYGGRHELIELNDSFDMAKSIFGELTKLERTAAQFTVERPGLSSFVAVAQDNSAVLAYLRITVAVISPLGRAEIKKSYRLYVRHDSIRITDDSDHAKPTSDAVS